MESPWDTQIEALLKKKAARAKGFDARQQRSLEALVHERVGWRRAQADMKRELIKITKNLRSAGQLSPLTSGGNPFVHGDRVIHRETTQRGLVIGLDGPLVRVNYIGGSEIDTDSWKKFVVEPSVRQKAEVKA